MNADAINGLSDLDGAVEQASPWLQDALRVPRKEGFIDVDGCQMHYFEWGDASKPSIVMLHGFLAHARCFAFIAPFLAQDYHIIAYDHSGMGDSQKRKAYSEQVRIAEMMGLCEQTGVFANGKKPIVIAHSYGGRVATATVSAYPDRFGGVIICDLMIIRPAILREQAHKFGPPGGGRDPDRPHKVYPDYAAAKKRFVLSPPQAVEEPELFDFMAYHSLQQVEGGWQWKFDPAVFRRTQDGEKSWSTIGEIVVTTPGRKAIIFGEQSLLFTADSVNYVEELTAENKAEPIPMIAIPNARHHLMLDQPMAFVTALRSVLASWQASTLGL